MLPKLDPYFPTNSSKVLLLVQKAVDRNAERDRIERQANFATPADGGVSSLLRTSISAIVSGIETDDWDCVAEGLVFVMQAEPAVRQLEQQENILLRKTIDSKDGGQPCCS